MANHKLVLEFTAILEVTPAGFITPVLRTLDTHGGLRVWQAHIGAKDAITIDDVTNKTDVAAPYWYSVSGLDSGKKIISEKKFPKEKNIGKENATTKLTQTILDVRGEYMKRLKKGYFLNIADAGKDMPFPMALHDVNKGKNWAKIHFPAYIQPKYDGTLYVVRETNAGLVGITRGREIYEGQTHLLDELRGIQLGSWCLIGEIWSKGYNLQDISGASRTSKSDVKMEYWIFDCAPLDASPTFEERQAMLDKLLLNIKSPFIKRVPTFKVESKEAAESYYKSFIEQGLEGAIIRNVDAPYEWGSYGEIRVYHSMKWKPRFDAEFPLIDFTEGKKGKDVGAVVFILQASSGSTFNATPNWTYAQRWDAYKRLKDADIWQKVRGKAMTVEYSTISNDGVPQQPKVIGFRDTKLNDLLLCN